MPASGGVVRGNGTGGEGPARPWLIRLRWLALLAFLALPFGSNGSLGGGHSVAFIGLIGAMAATNAALSLATRSARDVRRELVGAVLILDTGLLTCLLFLSGGAVNPGTVVYLVQIAFAAVLLGPGWAWTLTGLSVAGFGALVLGKGPLAGAHVHGQTAAALATHITGMWVAFAVTASLIAHFVGHVAGALAQRERELADARTLANRNERLAALTTLAAGAAHELSTPLATIAVTAREIERTAALSGCPRARACSADAALIASEIARCRRVLDELSGRARGCDVDARPLCLPAALHDACRSLACSDAARVEVTAPPAASVPGLPHDELVGVLVALLRNAFDASAPSARVVLSAEIRDGSITLLVRDTGSGIPPDVLARVDEPFFTTKPPGQGLGLGVFLARSVVEQLGGRFRIDSTVGVGTTAAMTFAVPETSEQRL